MRTTVDDDPSTAPVFFIHVMKTGGTTIFRHLTLTYSSDAIYPDPEEDFRYVGPRLDIRHHLSISYLAGLPEDRRRRIRVYTGHFPYVTTEMLGGPFVTMTLLRDPVERTISLLRQFKRQAPGVQDLSRPSRHADAALEDVYDNPAVFEPLVLNHQTKIFSMRPSDDPESYMDVLAVDEERLAIAKATLEEVDLLGLTERYGDFLDDLRSALGWHVNRGAKANESPSDTQPVSDSLRRRIAADNAFDLELYAYARNLVARRRGRRTMA